MRLGGLAELGGGRTQNSRHDRDAGVLSLLLRGVDTEGVQRGEANRFGAAGSHVGQVYAEHCRSMLIEGNGVVCGDHWMEPRFAMQLFWCCNRRELEAAVVTCGESWRYPRAWKWDDTGVGHVLRSRWSWSRESQAGVEDHSRNTLSL